MITVVASATTTTTGVVVVVVDATDVIIYNNKWWLEMRGEEDGRNGVAVIIERATCSLGSKARDDRSTEEQRAWVRYVMEKLRSIYLLWPAFFWLSSTCRWWWVGPADRSRGLPGATHSRRGGWGPGADHAPWGRDSRSGPRGPPRRYGHGVRGSSHRGHYVGVGRHPGEGPCRSGAVGVGSHSTPRGAS